MPKHKLSVKGKIEEKRGKGDPIQAPRDCFSAVEKILSIMSKMEEGSKTKRDF